MLLLRSFMALLFRGKRYWLLLFHPRTPWYIKILAIVAVIYLIFPQDLLPDWIIGYGWIDDIIVIAMVLNFILKALRQVEDDVDG